MPAITAGKVLVTGANGYIAMWVVKSLLSKGFSVRGTVRSESKVAHLKDTFKDFGDKLEVVVVPDITKEGAFDDAVRGVDAIAHTASPFHMNVKDPQELIVPAVAGTGSILQSVLKFANDTVKRVVITSSAVAIFNPVTEPRVFDETDWNDASVREVETLGAGAAPFTMYSASKTLAERSAWQFVENNKEKLNWDLAVVNPPFVYGPVLHEVSAPESLNTSMHDWYDVVVKKSKTDEQLVESAASWVDVRDIGLAHALALEKEEAGGERIIVCSGAWYWQEWVGAAHKYDASFRAGDTSYDPKSATFLVKYDNSKSKRILGIQYIGIEQSTADMLKQFKEKGWLP